MDLVTFLDKHGPHFMHSTRIPAVAMLWKLLRLYQLRLTNTSGGTSGEHTPNHYHLEEGNGAKARVDLNT